MTLLAAAPVERPSVVDGAVILERGSPIVWFSFPGRHHDIGRFHRADGQFTGWYANVLTPVEGLEGSDWRTTDLFLDVWLPAGASAFPRLLDEDELDEAIRRDWVDVETASLARAEAERLLQDARAGTWPPAVARAWTLERAMAEQGHPRDEGV